MITMTLTFYTNFINHHQVPLAREFVKLIGDGYKMVTFEPLPLEIAHRGYPDYSNEPYLIEAFSSSKKLKYAEKLAITSDIIILGGGAPEYFITTRLKHNKLTFRYEERFFKNIDFKFIKPSFYLNLFKQHTKYRYKPLYYLGAGAYCCNDAYKLFAYPNKCLKWGYFTRVPTFDIQQALIDKRKSKVINIFWCGHCTPVKKPSLVVKLAKLLKQKSINAHITMVCSGGLVKDVKAIININEVSDYISVKKSLPNDDLQKMMRSHHIFLFTSNRSEGWGAVLNESMANGCAPICSDKVGAAPFLINGSNGLLFKSGDINDLYKQTTTLIKDNSLREQLSLNAHRTLLYEWSPKIAAENFIKFAEAKLTGKKENPITKGPCSNARPYHS